MFSLLEVDLGEIKSFKNLNLNQDFLNKNADSLGELDNYKYKISLVGKEVQNSSDAKLTNNLLNLNTGSNNTNNNYISPAIFHDEEEENNKHNIKADSDSPLKILLANPIVLMIFLSVGYYFYPMLWKKEYFMNLSQDFNNLKLLNQNTYDYVNYRRGLYISVRSNFS